MEEKKVFPAVSFDEFPPTSYEEWKEAAVETLKGGDFDKRLRTKTYEGITLNPIYTQADVDALGVGEAIPGYDNYLRGATAEGYLKEAWAIAQSSTACCPKEANKLALEELNRGADAVNFKVGPGGVDVSDKDGVAALLNGILFDACRAHIDCGASARQFIEDACAVNSTFKAARGMVGADPVGTLAASGALSKPLDSYLNDMAESAKYAKANVPGIRVALADGNVYANGGADAVLELAAVLSTASYYISSMIDRGVSADDAAKSVRLSFALGSNFFMEIAKLRAARVLYAAMAEGYGASADACRADVFARTSSLNKTLYDPYVNILRATTETFSGVVGGINALEVAPLDEPYGSSDEQTRRIARNIQVMMQEEFNLLSPVDPAGGSWYVESLTAELAKAAWERFCEIEAAGGIVAALESGDLQNAVAVKLSERTKKISTRADRIVGTNMYANMTEKRLERPAVEKKACEIQNPAVKVAAIPAVRLAEPFEKLRKATEDYEARTGKSVQVFLCNMGPVSQHKARADFSCGFFEVGHFKMLNNSGFATVEEAAAAAVKSGADVAVICSTDDTYPELVPPLAAAIKKDAPNMTVMLAGAPAAEYKDSYVNAGVDEFIHVRANCYEILSKIQSERGIC